MISTPLVIALAVASIAIVVALMMWKPRRRFSTRGEKADGLSRDATFASLLVSFAASIGLARSQAEHPVEGGHSWPGSHLPHGGDNSAGGFSDGGSGDAGGGGL